ncbi:MULTISPECIES: GNAT family N-acetyltransferase [unclassified Streptomyces]|uniref:GNAT family N-acetyltransferase n=1 Tax=unclassified Streptomyces TaxID=2593676 RepID=UPI002E131AA6|nr:GNAT family N-acetyltransferase [Streptomyces sp. NBC_01208]
MNRDVLPAPRAGTPTAAARPRARVACPADAEGIIALRAELTSSEPLDAEWTALCSRQLARRLAPGGDARAYVAETPDGSLVSCALGLIHPLLPAPAYPKGLAARVHAVATHPRYRHRGLARELLSALLDHLQADGATLFELRAAADAMPLYRELGFAADPASMRMTRLHRAGRRIEEPAGPVLLPVEEYASTVPKSTGSAFIFFTDRHDRPLQLRATYSRVHPWQFPGGTTDHGERPWQTAQRECHEETGLVVEGPPRLLASVFGLPGGEWPFSTTGCVFDGGRLTDEQIRSIVLDPDEHDAVRVLPLEEWEPLMPPQDFARLDAVMTARLTGTAAYFDSWGWGK